MIELESVFSSLTDFKKGSLFHNIFSNSFYTAILIALVLSLLAYFLNSKKKISYMKFFIYSAIFVSIVLIFQFKVLESNFKETAEMPLSESVEIEPAISGGTENEEPIHVIQEDQGVLTDEEIDKIEI